MNNFIVYPVYDRADWRLTPNDIINAMDVYKKQTGKKASEVVLHPNYEKRPVAVPDGVTVTYSFKVLAHEVFLPCLVDPPKAADALPDEKDVVAKVVESTTRPVETEIIMQQEVKQEDLPVLQLYPVSKRGRPLKFGEVHRTTLWRRQKKQSQVVMV